MTRFQSENTIRINKPKPIKILEKNPNLFEPEIERLKEIMDSMDVIRRDVEEEDRGFDAEAGERDEFLIHKLLEGFE